MSKLLIVESPTKARTIGRMLGKEYAIMASMGHIRDLPEREFGIDIAHGFAPQYVDTARSRAVVRDLRAAAKKADEIYLAPDPDREGEAIAWHLAEVLDKSTKAPFYRVSFHEITRGAIERAKRHDIPVLIYDKKAYSSLEEMYGALCAQLVGLGVEYIVLAGYLTILTEPLLSEFADRIVNIHPSLIPSFCGKGYYGLKVHEAALERGVKVVGATVHFVDEGTDTGPIILQKAVETQQGDTPEVLQRRVMEQAEWIILPRAIDLIANGKVRVEGRRTVIEE